MRRLRTSWALREMLAEVSLSTKDLIAPVFVRPGENIRNPIASMPGQFQFSQDTALEYISSLRDAGILSVLLFGVIEDCDKDPLGTQAWLDDAPVQKLCSAVKSHFPEMVVIADTCLCEYTSHGHCGPIVSRGNLVDVHNDQALELIAKTAVSQARAGADIVAPSAMMDGQISAIRTALDQADFTQTAIMSYAVKFASSMYGPFRDAAQSPPKQGDRKTYQMDYRTPSQAILEATLDSQEAADFLMVKPAATYLDIISQVAQISPLPLAAYHVSGEYSQIKAAAQLGWLDEKQAVLEVTSAIKRAGANLIITYFAKQIAGWLK